jgi:hypothetical protein
MSGTYEYDVAVSYAGPDRGYAEQLAEMLRAAELGVFFDLFEEATILGKRLYTFLQDVYENKARYCVVLLSQHYADRVWPRHEIQAAFNRAAREKGDYILPIRLDDARIEGLPSDLAYLSAKGRSVQDVAKILIAKIRPEARPGVGTVKVYLNRSDALENFQNELRAERYSITVVGTGAWFGRESPAILALMDAAMREPGPRMRFIFPNPTTMETRAPQELRAPGQLKLEIQHSIQFLHQRLPAAELRLVSVLPVYSALCLSHAVLYSPYLHTRGAFATPAFVYRRAERVARLYDMVADDLERLWSQATVTEMC